MAWPSLAWAAPQPLLLLSRQIRTLHGLRYAAAASDAAVVLCDLLCAQPRLVAGHTVVELGAGTGIVAIVASNKAKATAQGDPEHFNLGGVRTGGFVCGIIGTVISAISTLFILFALIAAGSVASQMPG